MRWPGWYGRRGGPSGLAESLTGGLASSRLVNVPGASRWFQGSVVSYASAVKFAVLGVPEGPVVSEEAARAMAEGARKVLDSDVGLSITGVAGPDPRTATPGTVFVGLARAGRPTESFGFNVPGDRDRVRQYATIAALDLLPTGSEVRRRDSSAGGVADEHSRGLPAAGASGGGGRRPPGPHLRASPGCRSGPAPPRCSRLQRDRRPVGGGEGGRLGEAGSAPGAGDGRVVPHTSSGPDPMAVTWTSRPPSEFSTQGPSEVWTVMITTLAAVVWDPSSRMSGDPE